MSNDASASDLRGSLVSFSVDELEQSGDDHSDLTGPCSDEDDDSREDDFGIKHAVDPYYYHAVDGAANPLETTEQEQELFKLKLQIERQQERLYLLSSKLSHCEAENEALKTEKAILVDELARAATASKELLIPNAIKQRWLSKDFGNSSSGDSSGATMQMLIDTNTELVNDNARLQALADITRKSLKSHIEDSRRGDGKQEETIRNLQKENERLRGALATAMHLANNTEHSRSSRTSKTSLTRSLTEAPLGHASRTSYLDSPSDHADSAPELVSIPEQELQLVGPGNGSNEGGISIGEREEVPNLPLVSQLPTELVQRASFAKKAANATLPNGEKVTRDVEDCPLRRSEPKELLVDSGGMGRLRRRPRYRQPKTADQRLIQSFTLGVTTQPVKFGADMDGPLNQSFTLGTTIRMPMNSGRETVGPATSGNCIREPASSGEEAVRDAVRALAREADGAAGPPSPSGDGGGGSHGRSYANLLVERLSQSLPQSLSQLPIEPVQRASFTKKTANAISPNIDTEDDPRTRSESEEPPVNSREASRPRRGPRYRQSKMADERLTQSYTLGVTTQPIKFGADVDGPLNQSFTLGRETTEPVNFGDRTRGPSGDAAGESAGEVDGGGGESRGRSYADLLAEFGRTLARRRRGAERRPSQGLSQSLTDAKSKRGEELLVDFDAARRARSSARRSSSVRF